MTKIRLGKFDPRSDEGIFLGYSSRSKAYKVFNKVTNKVEESIHVAFDESFVLQDLDSSGEDFTFQSEDTPGSQPTPTSNHVESDSEEEDSTPKLVPSSVQEEPCYDPGGRRR